jgi:hypothetical protein
LAVPTKLSYPIDLRLRWTEEQLLLHGVDPQLAGHPDPELPVTHEAMKKLGGSYPPWAYATGLVLVPPLPWPMVRWYAVLENLVALGVLGLWAYRQVLPFGRGWAWLAVGSSLSMFPAAICLSYGQYGVVVAAGLAAVDMLLDRRNLRAELLSGVVLGVTLVKPQLSALFALAVLLEGRWLSAATCGAYLAAASGLVWVLTGSDPVTMLGRTVQEASAFSYLSHNPLVHFSRSLFGFRSGTAILGLAGSLAGVALLVSTRSKPRVVRWSACALISMFWAYRRHYDTPLLIFPLVGLLLAALERRSRMLWSVYTILGLTLWAPIRIAQWELLAVQMIDLVVWTGAIVPVFWLKPCYTNTVIHSNRGEGGAAADAPFPLPARQTGRAIFPHRAPG